MTIFKRRCASSPGTGIRSRKLAASFEKGEQNLQVREIATQACGQTRIELDLNNSQKNTLAIDPPDMVAAPHPDGTQQPTPWVY
jgi:hypothetical protein